MLKSNLVAKVELLSNVHIGTGTNLIQGLDWYRHSDGYVYLADDAQLMDQILTRAADNGQNEVEVINAITEMTLDDLVTAGWLETSDFGKECPLFRYRLKGETATREIHEQIKDVHGQPYLPGSTFKGALRTVLAMAAAAEINPNLNNMKRSPRWAAVPIEQELFGNDPFHDLLRMLQVGDSQPVSADALRLRKVHIYPTAGNTRYGKSQGLDLDMEMLVQGTRLEIPIHQPLELITKSEGEFEKRRSRELGAWDRGRPWLENLCQHSKAYARHILEEEISYFSPRRDVIAVHRFYGQLVDRFSKLESNQFMLSIGWGCGWHTKVISKYLKQDPKRLDKIIWEYNLNPTGEHAAGDPFPSSRHLLRQPDGTPGNPLGWVLVTLNEK